MRSTRDFFVGTLTGLTIGLLAAPRAGRESRQWLKAEYDKRAGSASGPGLKDRLTSAFEQVKEMVNKYNNQKKVHEQRMANTGHFDYQIEREQQLTSPNLNTSAEPSPAATGLH